MNHQAAKIKLLSKYENDALSAKDELKLGGKVLELIFRLFGKITYDTSQADSLFL